MASESAKFIGWIETKGYAIEVVPSGNVLSLYIEPPASVLLYRGKLTAFEVMNLMTRCNPPVGWGKLCPQTLAYKVKPNCSTYSDVAPSCMYLLVFDMTVVYVPCTNTIMD